MATKIGHFLKFFLCILKKSLKTVNSLFFPSQKSLNIFLLCPPRALRAISRSEKTFRLSIKYLNSFCQNTAVSVILSEDELKG